MESRYRRERREAIVAALLWLLAGLWTVTVSYWLGYHGSVRSWGGIPAWVVWGILLPWVVFFLIHSWYSLFYLRGEGDAPPAPPPDSSGERE